ncbi:MAG: glycosyltransferase family 4 protein, partial [Planctomycetales bacterium]
MGGRGLEIVYASYDRFPAVKGAATHIAQFASGLADAFGQVDLVTVAPSPEEASLVSFQHSGVDLHPLTAPGNNLIERVMNFRAGLRCWWKDRRADVLHVRSIYEGYPFAREKRKTCDKLVLEVNGLPSIELKYTYPAVADDRELLGKLKVQEDACLAAADLVITVSQVNADYLVSRGVERERIRVIPNGVDLNVFAHKPPRRRADEPIRLLYAGTWSSWQGVHAAVEALALCLRDFPARLTLAGPSRPRQRKLLEQLCWKLGVHGHVDRVGSVSQADLCRLHHESDAALAPLTANDRNLVQGCCPLKMLEAMACGTPLVASDLPVARELARFDQDA